jgi:hypothetical protein
MPLRSADEALITQMFLELSPEIDKYFYGYCHVLTQISIMNLTEAWAKEIIYILTHKRTLSPPLEKSTIARRKRRYEKSLLGYDFPLVETGMWATFIEFRIQTEGDRYILEVGVYDDTTRIGHNNVTPAWLAVANEYGILVLTQYDEIVEAIPARYPFSKSESRLSSQIDKVLEKSWRRLERSATLDKAVMAFVTYGQASTFQKFSQKGRIIHNGINFAFQWDEVEKFA